MLTPCREVAPKTASSQQGIRFRASVLCHRIGDKLASPGEEGFSRA
jgi:hypothetical protein